MFSDPLQESVDVYASLHISVWPPLHWEIVIANILFKMCVLVLFYIVGPKSVEWQDHFVLFIDSSDIG